MELIFDPSVNFSEFQWVQSAKSTLLTSTMGPWDLFRFLRSVQMLKREWVAESNGKLPHLFNPSKTATLVPEFAMEDLPLDRNAALMPKFAVKELPFGQTTLMKMMNNYMNNLHDKLPGGH